MDKHLLASLSAITEEEKEILAGSRNINRDLYYSAEGSMSKQNEIDASRLLAKGKLIDIRPHTRFVHFPEHTHNFIEFVYMCKGSTKHIIDGQRLTLQEGDLLFMNRHAKQEILPADKDDIAVNFIIMPQFFDSILNRFEGGSGALYDFIVSCLTDKHMGGNYLYFDVSGVLPVQNLMENLIWIMLNSPINRRSLSQATMALLFRNLVDNADRIQVSGSSYEQNMMIQLLNYIETEYKDAALTDFAERNHVDIYTMSRMIKRRFGKTFKELLVEKKMNQACYLLKNTKLSVTDIAYSIGYENTSYFHRTFRAMFELSPRDYRIKSTNTDGSEQIK